MGYTGIAAPELDKEGLCTLLNSGGMISRTIAGFETREQQISMLGNIIDAYNEHQVALIEAGTGTGKSMAYLIPAILWAHIAKERTVISTNTINLQEQLLHKDIPLLLKALNIELKAVLVKGMGNYVCLRKLDEALQERLLMEPREIEEVNAIEGWSSVTKDGSRSSLPLVPSGGVWEKVCAEHDTCTHNKCPRFRDCFYFKARDEAKEASLLVVNHHLLCSDLSTRPEPGSGQKEGLLPEYTRVILDEAHNFEDVATDFFADEMNQLGMLRSLALLASEKQGKESGKISQLRQHLRNAYPREMPQEVTTIEQKLHIEIPAARIQIGNLLQKACEAFGELLRILSPNADEQRPGESYLRLRDFHITHPFWEKGIVPAVKPLIEEIRRLAQTIDSIERGILSLKNEKLNEKCEAPLHEVRGLMGRLREGEAVLETFLSGAIPPTQVRWIEIGIRRGVPIVILKNAKLDLSEDLSQYLFNKFPTTVLVSATLSTNHQFQFIRQRLGLHDPFITGKQVLEKIYDSPFDYERQTLLAIPTDMPPPHDPSFIEAAVEKIWVSIQASRGNAFVLFTSYSMLQTCYQKMEARLREARYHPMKQGDTNRKTLIANFKNQDRSVLFGTDSFWEGVDVAGDALRCVILVKLPFRVPTEPIIQGRSEAIQSAGGDPFTEYSLPMAIVKFKQGFGRLIRNRRDYGAIVCLDNRLISKGYGKQFLNSLPKCQESFSSGDDFKKSLTDFYRQKFHR